LFSVIAPRFLELAEADETVDVLVQDGNTAAAFLYPPRMHVFSVDYRRFRRSPIYRYRTSRALQDRRYRLAVSADHLRLPTVDDALIAACSAERTIAMEPRSWPKHDAELARNRRLYTTLVEVQGGMAHRLIRWLELINATTGCDEPPPVVAFPIDRLPPAAELSAPSVLIHPFSSEKARQFPAPVWEMIVACLPDGFEVILSASPDDLRRNPEFAGLVKRPGVRLDLQDLEAKLSTIRAARFVVSVDTSIMHLAVGTGVPTLCLCSAAHVVDSVPYDPRMTPRNVRFLFHDMPCRGCLGTCIHPLKDGCFPCVTRLPADEIEAAVGELIRETTA
jgi:ADP-heptose:LPS heptosyltransferase